MGDNGSGFPTDTNGNPIVSVTFNCLEAWVHPVHHLVELWAIDKAGNIDSCRVDVSVADNYSLCNFDPTTNGVTTYDLVLISKHILDTEPLNSPYKIIAADANKSGSITTIDIVEIRKLILGIYDSFPNNQSWRFVDENFSFPNVQNPFQTNLADTIVLIDWSCSFTQTEFTGIKVGDVNNTAIPNANTPPPAESRAPCFLAFPDTVLEAGETVEIPLRSTEKADWLGLQFSVYFDPELLDIEGIESSALPDFDQNNWTLSKPGRLNLSWSSAQPNAFSPGAEVVRLRIKAHSDMLLSKAFKNVENPRLTPEAYEMEGVVRPLQIVFSENGATETSQVFAPQPNPTTAGAMLPIQLSQAQTLRLEVRDISGKLLWDNELSLEKGTHTLEIPASAMPQAGMYVWRVLAGGDLKIGKLTKG